MSHARPKVIFGLAACTDMVGACMMRRTSPGDDLDRVGLTVSATAGEEQTESRRGRSGPGALGHPQRVWPPDEARYDTGVVLDCFDSCGPSPAVAGAQIDEPPRGAWRASGW